MQIFYYMTNILDINIERVKYKLTADFYLGIDFSHSNRRIQRNEFISVARVSSRNSL